MKPDRIEILGVPVDVVTMATALDYVEELLTRGGPSTVLAVNPEKVMKARQDPALLRILRAAALLIPDGIGIVGAARFLGLARMERVPGIDLMLAICKRAAERGYRLFLFGSRPEANEAACVALREAYPGIQIVGHRNGYVSASEMPELIAEINACGADIVFVGLGSPRQEDWIASNLRQLRVKVCQGVGGSFDVLAGTVQRAPESWRARNLEWAYRLLADPRRLTRQTALPRFACRVLWARTGRTPGQRRPTG